MPLGSIIGGILGQGANSAAGSQAAAAGEAAYGRAQELANTDRANLSPWRATGVGANAQIASLLGLGQVVPIGDPNASGWNGSSRLDSSNWQSDQQNALARFQTDPGYQFRLQQGVNAIDRSGAARGVRLSGAQTKALSDYGQATGSQEYGNYFNRLAAASGQGQTAATAQNASANQAILPGIQDQFSGQLAQGQYNVAGSNALASGLLGAQNSLTSLFSGGGAKFGLPKFA